ncbi:MAG: hypothetical protein ABSF88_02700 [Candidatus Aminicenantales bacterium]
MAIKKKVLVFALFAICTGTLRAQWRADVAQIFSKDKDYKELSDYLVRSYDNLENTIDKADASGLLAFAFGRQNDPLNETRWIVEYFEICKAQDTGFAFLDLVSQADVLGWLNAWKSRYPFISEIALIKGIGDQTIVPQGILPLVVVVANEALYKFSRDGNVLEGGQLKAGFNIIALDANELVLNPGTRVYILEIKAGGLILKKEITLDVEASAPRIPPPQPAAASGPPLEYKLSMYVGGELVMSSQKREYPVSWQIGVKPNPNPFGFKPDWMLHRNEPDPMNSISIPAVISALYSLLKDLFKKKDNKDVEPPKIQTVQDLNLTFKMKDKDGWDQESKVLIKLRTKNLPYVRSVP